MATTTWNQDINAGSDWNAAINLMKKDNTNRDVRGCTFSSKVKRHYTSAAFQEISIVIENGTLGTLTFNLTDAQTTIMKNGKYLYDVELIGAPVLTVSGALGNFAEDEIITGTSGATGKVILHDAPTNTIKYEATSGTFVADETITGSSTSTETVVSLKTGDTERVISGVITVRPEVT